MCGAISRYLAGSRSCHKFKGSLTCESASSNCISIIIFPFFRQIVRELDSSFDQLAPTAIDPPPFGLFEARTPISSARRYNTEKVNQRGAFGASTACHENIGAAKNPPVLRPAPFDKGGHWGISCYHPANQ